MSKKLDISKENYTLTDSELTQEFVKMFRKGTDVNISNESACRALGAAMSMEDIAFVATNVEEITPKQKALLQINSNLAVAGTDEDAEQTIPENIAVEDFKQSSNKVMSDLTLSFPEMWEQISMRITSLKDITGTIGTQTESLSNEAARFRDEGSNVIPAKLFVEMCDGILSAPNSVEGDYLIYLEGVRNDIRTHISTITMNSIVGIRKVMKSGMFTFGGNTSTVANEKFKQYKSELMNVAKENITTSEDGLIVDVVLTDGYRLSTNDETEFPTLQQEAQKSLDSNESYVEVTVDAFDKVSLQAKDNLEIISMIDVVSDMLREKSLAGSVVHFSKVVESLLESLPVHSRTKNSVIDYCDLFIKAVKLVNNELDFMLYACRFVSAHNELLTKIKDSALSSKNTEVDK